MSDYPYKSRTYTYSYTVRILKRRKNKKTQTTFGNYPKKLWIWGEESYSTFDGFVECTRIPYMFRKSLMEPDPWGTLEVVLKKRKEPFRGGIQRPPLHGDYNKPKGYY